MILFLLHAINTLLNTLKPVFSQYPEIIQIDTAEIVQSLLFEPYGFY